MTDSTPPPSPATPRAAESPAPLSRGEVALKILSASGDLQHLRRPTRIEGEVTKISRDGTTATIETDQGTIEVRLRESLPLQPGQKVEIDLPPGHPPRQIVLRPAPVETTQPSLQLPPPPLPPVANPVSPQPAMQPAVKNSLPPELRGSLDQLIPLPLRPVPQNPALLPPDSIVRLVPLPAMPPAAGILPLPVPVPVTLTKPAVELTAFQPLPIPASTASFPVSLSQTKILPLIQQSGWTARADSRPVMPFQIVTPVSVSAPSQMTAPDFIPLQKSSIVLPLMQQIQPFIMPVIAQPVAVPEQKFDMRVTAIDPAEIMPEFPAKTEKAESIPNSPVTVTARIVATTIANFPVLSMVWPGQETSGFFTLQFPATNLPVGTKIELMRPLAPLPGLAPQIDAAITPPLTLLTGWTWPVFDEAIDLLAPAGMPSPAAQSFANILPNPTAPAQMPAAILFFMAAIGAGDLPGWIGEKNINALRREGTKGSDIIQRLTRDFAGLSRMTDEPVSQDWKALAIPMMWENAVNKINLFYRHQDSEKNEEREDQGERSTRFLFDLNLTRIGPLQLDGFMKSRRLDLIVRTRTPFSQTMQGDMRRLYNDTLGKGNLTGDLGFQNRLDQWVTVDVRRAEIQTTA